MRGWISDLGFALRVMARKPQASLMLIATLVLGISVTTAMFSVLDAVLLRPLPFVDPERVVILVARASTSLITGIATIRLNIWLPTIRAG